jgi:hypothetical protein
LAICIPIPRPPPVTTAVGITLLLQPPAVTSLRPLLGVHGLVLRAVTGLGRLLLDLWWVDVVVAGVEEPGGAAVFDRVGEQST